MAKWQNVTGKRFGKLTAVEYLGRSRWKCVCDCGNEVTTTIGHLNDGHTKSCGCVRPPRKNLVGQHFGYLTVVKWVGNGKWRCICACGNQVDVQTGNLRSGNTQSCGCYQRQRTSETCLVPMIGKRFGKLTVVERMENNRYGHVQYKCLCDCGGSVITEAERLRQGRVQSCGCIKSRGEMEISLWLKEHKIRYRTQFSHDEIFLSSGRRPFFDFVLLDRDNRPQCFIEYQGDQHYGYSGYGWNNEQNYFDTVRRDTERREACYQINIPLYEICKIDFPYLGQLLESIVVQFPDVYLEDDIG